MYETLHSKTIIDEDKHDLKMAVECCNEHVNFVIKYYHSVYITTNIHMEVISM